MTDEDETCMMHVPERLMGEKRAGAPMNWGAPLVGIHSVGDTHFGDTQFDEPQFGEPGVGISQFETPRVGKSRVAHQQDALAAPSRPLEPVKARVRRLNLQRDPDATPIHAPDAALLQSLQPESKVRAEFADQHADAAVAMVSRLEGRSKVQSAHRSLLSSLRLPFTSLCARVRRMPSPLLGVLLGGLIGLISALLIHFQKQQADSLSLPSSQLVSPAPEPQAPEAQALAPVALEPAAPAPLAPKPQMAARASFASVGAFPEKKVDPSPSNDGGSIVDELAARALSLHLTGRCAQAMVSYQQLEQQSSEREEQKLWREFARASHRGCIAVDEGEAR